MAKLPTTPPKLHYLFNIRDLSGVFAGLCKATSSQFLDLYSFIRLQGNEYLRVFSDRLTNLENRKFVLTKIETLMDINSSSSREVALKQPILFDNFISDSGPDGALIYKDLDQHRSLVPFFTELL